VAVGEQVILGCSAHRVSQALSEFALQEPHYLADTLQGESLAAQLADHCDLSEILYRVHTTVPFPGRDNHTALIPPLQLPGSNSGQLDNIARCESVIQFEQDLFQTI